MMDDTFIRTVSIQVAGVEVWPPSWWCMAAAVGLLTVMITAALVLLIAGAKGSRPE